MSGPQGYQSFPPEPIRRASVKLARLEKLIEPAFAHLRKLYIENDCREPTWTDRLNGNKTKEQLFDWSCRSVFRSKTEYGLILLIQHKEYNPAANALYDITELCSYKDTFSTLAQSSGDILLPVTTIKALYKLEQFNEEELLDNLKQLGFEETIDE